MTKSIFACAAALALPFTTPALSQVPARINLDLYTPIAGSWSYRAIPGGSEAAFSDSSAARRLVVRCTRANRSVAIARTGVPAAAPALTVWTSSSSRNLPARFESSLVLTAEIAARDSLLDAIAFSRGRFATAAAGAPMVTLPTSPEAARVVEDCRS